ncbi:MAG: NAD(P)H-hydrate dehydratase [Clostridia bacterium]|nr:NAD(P)H-hydrate dehydratase [Clostridia bacterium]
MTEKSLDLISANGLLPRREQNSHKGTYGNVLLICGSKNMVGCCALAAEGALRSGAGLVTIAFPDVLYTALTSRLTECLFLPLPTDECGFISHLAMELLLPAIEKADVVTVGCGIGVGFAQSLVTTTLLECENKPVIFDADALNCIAQVPEMLQKATAKVLLTPHPGEMSRLTGLSVSEIEANRQKAISDFCKKYNVSVLLKGHRTLICNASGDQLYVNTTGNSALAKGGAGDLLTGIIAGLTPALKGNTFDAGVLGAFVHGLSADIATQSMSEYSVLPSDCAKRLGEVYYTIEKSGNS